MADNNTIKECENEKDLCKRQVRAICLHCSKNLCRIHLIEHTQLIEENVRSELNTLADKFNELSSKFNDLSISSDFLEQPFSQLEQWRRDAHNKIDEIIEKKRQEINDKIDEYKKLFTISNLEQLEKINASKKLIAELIQDTDASHQQISDLQTCIDNTENYLNSLTTHKINTISHPLIWPVDIHTQHFQAQPISSINILRDFKITYIRLDGIIRRHYVNANIFGTMNNLIRVFIQRYPLLEALARSESSSTIFTDHQPKYDFVLPAEVHGRCIRTRYSNDHKLVLISDYESIVFYETSFPLSDHNHPNILMACAFQRLSNKTPFGWPIYLNVPRTKCRGQDVQDALQNVLGNFFPLNPNTDRLLYDAYLSTSINGYTKQTKLNTILQNELDFSKTHVTLFVNIANLIVEQYEQNALI
ncbi:unnamed protein product [Adineta steineri]|uniref:Uncharacterized protein n=1 Tax=Adineta steineri TaxID=433720 RepID=A0A813NX69_9BILA|nr:unnamed protein product [Adineta steineri]CAF3773226.1 unnamed protein product [Adineta steineri]